MSVEVRKPRFVLRSVHTIEFLQNQWPDKMDIESDLFELGYNTSFGCYYDEERKICAIKTELELIARHDDDYDSPQRIASLTTVTSFGLLEDEDTNQSLLIALDFVANMIGISYSTTRGILLGRVPNQQLELYPPPAINPREIAHEMNLDWTTE